MAKNRDEFDETRFEYYEYDRELSNVFAKKLQLSSMVGVLVSDWEGWRHIVVP